MMENNYHVPVLLEACIEGLNIKPDGVYVDVTFGGGGHSREILKKLGKDGMLIAFDQDPDAKEIKLMILVLNLWIRILLFLKNNLRLLGYKQVDGILADLGVSSHQFNEPERGFSTRFESSLDMRMDKQGNLTAADVLIHMRKMSFIRFLVFMVRLKMQNLGQGNCYGPNDRASFNTC